jgi:hypothetical protein
MGRSARIQAVTRWIVALTLSILCGCAIESHTYKFYTSSGGGTPVGYEPLPVVDLSDSGIGYAAVSVLRQADRTSAQLRFRPLPNTQMRLTSSHLTVRPCLSAQPLVLAIGRITSGLELVLAPEAEMRGEVVAPPPGTSSHPEPRNHRLYAVDVELPSSPECFNLELPGLASSTGADRPPVSIRFVLIEKTFTYLRGPGY